jgi:hypothetical protein
MAFTVVNLFHIFFTGPFMVYVGFVRPKQDWIYYIMSAMAIVAGIIIAYNLFGSPWEKHKIWYIAHLVLFIPLIAYISVYRQHMNPTFYAFLLAVGIAAIGYHAVKGATHIT